MENGLTKKQSAVLQGIAIWMMVYHHLYLRSEAYESLLPFMNADVAKGIAWFCKICVGLFAFVSGYGMYHVMSRKPAGRFFERLLEEYRHVLPRILCLYGRLWLVILIFKGVDFWVFGRSFAAAQLLDNLTDLHANYNGAWWYVEQYAKMLLALPFLDLLFTRFEYQEEKKKWIFFQTLTGVALAAVLWSFKLYELLLAAVKGMRPRFSLIFIVGYLTARYGLYQRINKALNRRSDWFCVCLSMVLIGVVVAVRVLFATDATWAKLDFLLVPILVYGALMLLAYTKPLSAFFGMAGNCSTYIWLTHGFFINWLFLPVRQYVRLDILAYLAVMLVSAVAAVLLKGVETGMRKIILLLFGRKQ